MVCESIEGMTILWGLHLHNYIKTINSINPGKIRQYLNMKPFL